METKPRDKRKKPELGDLSGWPRLLSAPTAGAYLGIHEFTFRAGVGTIWPEPMRVGRRKLWDRLAPNRAVGALSANQLASGTKAVPAAMDDAA